MASFTDRASLVAAIAEWDANAMTAEATYDHISHWNVSNVTDMSSLFSVRPTRPLKKPSDPFHRPGCPCLQSKYTFNSDLNAWDVSRVTTMANMFNVSARRRSNAGREPAKYALLHGSTDLSDFFACAHGCCRPPSGSTRISMHGTCPGSRRWNTCLP